MSQQLNYRVDFADAYGLLAGWETRGRRSGCHRSAAASQAGLTPGIDRLLCELTILSVVIQERGFVFSQIRMLDLAYINIVISAVNFLYQ